MKQLSPTRIELDRNKVESSKQQILNAAVTLSEQPGGWVTLTRDAVAAEAGCATGLVNKYFGTMICFRRSIMRHAILTKNLPVIAQGIAAGDKSALKADQALKRLALYTLTAA